MRPANVRAVVHGMLSMKQERTSQKLHGTVVMASVALHGVRDGKPYKSPPDGVTVTLRLLFVKLWLHDNQVYSVIITRPYVS